MNEEYARAHATIIPYTQFDDYLKLIPNSAIESLAAGKPILVSSKTEIAKTVREEQCGVVFEPNVASLNKAVQDLKRKYLFYQRRCLPTARKYFSQERYLKAYEDIYQELLP